MENDLGGGLVIVHELLDEALDGGVKALETVKQIPGVGEDLL